MSIETEYQERQFYLIAKVRGQWTERAARHVIEEVRAEARARGFTRVLLDVRELSAPDTEMTRFHTGKQIAQSWRPPLKVAALAEPGLINRFAETVATNRGARFVVFSDEAAAHHWLL